MHATNTNLQLFKALPYATPSNVACLFKRTRIQYVCSIRGYLTYVVITGWFTGSKICKRKRLNCYYRLFYRGKVPYHCCVWVMLFTLLGKGTYLCGKPTGYKHRQACSNMVI